MVIISVAWFGWFQLRPSLLRRYCYNNSFGKTNRWKQMETYDKQWAPEKVWTYNPTKSASAENWGWFYPTDATLSTSTYSLWYQQCLVKNGMKAELPFLR